MTALLDVRALTCTLPGGFRLGPLSVRVEAGEQIALAGPNGAGKSTLLKLLAGLLPATGGSIDLSEKSISSITSQERARRVAWVPQEMDAPPDMTVEALVGLGLHPRSSAGGWVPAAGGEKILAENLSRLRLSALRARAVGSLSGGERRRALLARALCQGAWILLLDEPTAHLDPRHQAELADILAALRKDKNVAVVMALHDIHWALETCDRLWLLAGGQLLADGPAAQVLTAANLSKAYGAQARVAPAADGWPARVHFSTQPQEEHP